MSLCRLILLSTDRSVLPNHIKSNDNFFHNSCVVYCDWCIMKMSILGPCKSDVPITTYQRTKL